MKRQTSHQGVVFLLVLLAGVGLHFLYDALPVFPLAIISPVDESLFQHAKLIYWPVLLGAFALKKWDGASLRPRLLGLLVGVAMVLGLGWLYHITLGGDALWVDIVLYVLSIVAAFLLVPKLLPAHPTGKGWEWAAYGVFLVGVLLILFTFFPPNHLLFTDLSGANTWTTLPC